MAFSDSKEGFISMDLSSMRPQSFLQTILNRQKNNVETVNKNNGWKLREECPVCQSTQKTFQFEKLGFELYQCNNCNTAFFNQIPVNTNDIYSAAHTIDDAQKAYLSNKDYRKVRFANERVELIEGYLKNGIKGTNVLDVGCGTGWFLEVAKANGANCFGVELGKDLADYTSEQLDIKVWNCDLSEVETDIRFDVITMFDLIEHVVSPVQLIIEAKELLREDGIIVIFTPQFDSLAIQTMKHKSNLIMPAEHLSYFTEKTVKKLAELTNMNIEYYVTKGIDLGDLKSYYENDGQPQIAEACETLYDIIQPIVDNSNSGNHLRAILRKN